MEFQRSSSMWRNPLSFHKGIACKITTLLKNNIKKLNSWSSVEEAIRFLKVLDDSENQKKNVIHQHLTVMGLFVIGCIGKIYPTNMIVRCFEYFAVSRALYSRLCKDYQLPSVRTLTRLTSKFSSLSDIQFIKNLFANLPKMQRKCVILLDEVYVKAALRYPLEDNCCINSLIKLITQVSDRFQHAR